MVAITKKNNSDKNTQSKTAFNKNKKSNASKSTAYGLSPMMPRLYSARERKEIRKKELQILKGVLE